jgi:hypothetical protein
MVIKGFCICGRQVSGGTDEILPRHHRHVAGSVARGRPAGRRATTRRIDRCVLPQRQRRQKSLDKAAGHRQVADKQQAAGGCGSSHGQLPERSPGELQKT